MPPRLIIQVSVRLNLSLSSPSTTLSISFRSLHPAIFPHCLGLFYSHSTAGSLLLLPLLISVFAYAPKSSSYNVLCPLSLSMI